MNLLLNSVTFIYFHYVSSYSIFLFVSLHPLSIFQLIFPYLLEFFLMTIVFGLDNSFVFLDLDLDF
jgi:hypothetical protein